MKPVRCCVIVCLLLPAAFGQKRDQTMVQMQRDIAILQDSVKTLQNSLTEKLAELKALSQQSVDAATKANTGVAVLESGMKERMSQQEKSVAGPVAAVNSKLDQMTSEFQGLKETIADMNGRLNKLQGQVVDLSNQIKVMSAPPAPPSADAGPATPPPGMTASGLFEGARRDQLSAKFDLAIQQFMDYLRYYGDTDLAPNAQYQIGECLYGKGDLQAALQSFDTAIEKYPEGAKMLDARYMKGMSLIKLNQQTKAAQEFRALIKLAPSSEQATKAKARLKELGLPYTAAAPVLSKSKSAAKKRK